MMSWARKVTQRANTFTQRAGFGFSAAEAQVESWWVDESEQERGSETKKILSMCTILISKTWQKIR
jgi:hypothetical protein